ncbi:MAG: hypothetical protein HY727_01435 [Candidatus Rokubacteria bacterium]|nr:hypothetical protein [Candidatus Rokubacteria bacterium]
MTPSIVRPAAKSSLRIVLAWLWRAAAFSSRLAEIRGPAFYHEIGMAEGEARAAADGAARVLAFGRDFLGRLRAT